MFPPVNPSPFSMNPSSGAPNTAMLGAAPVAPMFPPVNPTPSFTNSSSAPNTTTPGPAPDVPMFGVANESASNAPKAPELKLPTFGTGTPNFLAQFGKASEDTALAAKKKRKTEDFDSDEEDESTWDRKYEEEQRTKKQKVEELSKGMTTKLVDGKLEWVNPPENVNPPKSVNTDDTGDLTTDTDDLPDYSDFEHPEEEETDRVRFFEHPQGQKPVMAPDNIFGHLKPSPVASDDGDESSDEFATDEQFESYRVDPADFVLPEGDSNEEGDESNEEVDESNEGEDESNEGGNDSDEGQDNSNAEDDDSSEEEGDEDMDNIDPAKKRKMEEFLRGLLPSDSGRPANSPALGRNPPMNPPKLGRHPTNAPPKPSGSNAMLAPPKPSGVNPVETSDNPFSKWSQQTGSPWAAATKNVPKTDWLKPGGDATWKADNPIKFGEPSTLSKGKVTEATPSKSGFGGLFGAHKGNAAANPGSANSAAKAGLGFGFQPKKAASDASSRATSPDENASESGGDNEEKEAQPDVPPPRRPSQEGPEEVQHKVRAKALTWDKDKKEWITRGLGPLRLMCERKTGKVRMLMTHDPTGRVVINSQILRNFEYEKVSETTIRIPVINKEGECEPWLVKVGKEKDATDLWDNLVLMKQFSRG